MKIWVDDIRTPPAPSESWYWAKTSTATIEFLKVMRWLGERPEIMSLDHDLGGDDTTRPVVLWMCENEFWPNKVVVHSANPPGATWLQQMVERYHPNNAHKYTR